MRSLFKVVLIFSLPCATLLSFPLAQAKVPGQVCQALFDSELRQVKWYPVKPLPETIATDVVARQLDELEAIATSPNFLNLAIQTQLTPWLFEKPDPGPPDTGAPARMDELLKILPNSQKSKLTGIFDKLANRIEQLPSVSTRAEMSGKLADYYQQLVGTDRASLFLNRALSLALKSTDRQTRAVQVAKLLEATVDLGLSKAIASQLPQIENALSSNAPNLSLARAYADVKQSQKALSIANRVAKATSTLQVINSDLVTLYLQLNRLDKANQNIKTSVSDNDARYGRLVATYDRAKQPQIASKLFKEGFYSLLQLIPNDRFLNGYLKAGGNPDRLFTGLPTLEAYGTIDLRVDYSLRVAGEYRRRNEQKKSQTTITQFVQLVISKNVEVDRLLTAAISDGNRLEAETAFKQLLARNAFTKIEPPINFATKINALDTIEPLIQRFPSTDSNQPRIDLLQSLALAYANLSQPNKAIYIAEQIGRRNTGSFSAVDTLAQVATIFAKTGQTNQANIIFAKALDLASNIKEIGARTEAYAAISRAYTSAGQTEKAETTRQTAVKWALTLPNNSYILSSISRNFMLVNQIEAAWKTLQEISNNGDVYKQENINDIVSTALALGNLSIAQQAVDLQYSYGAPQLFAAFQLASSYLGRNRPTEAIKMLDRVADILNKQKQPDIGNLMSIVRMYAQAGRIDTALKMISLLSPSYTALRQEVQQYVNCYNTSSQFLRR